MNGSVGNRTAVISSVIFAGDDELFTVSSGPGREYGLVMKNAGSGVGPAGLAHQLHDLLCDVGQPNLFSLAFLFVKWC